MRRWWVAFMVLVTAAVVPAGSSGASNTQFTLFSQTLVHTSSALGQPAFSGPSNWKSPVDFADGRAYLRMQVTSKPSAKPVFAQVCMWRNNFSIETCTGGFTFTTVGTYYLDLGVPSTWYKRHGVWDYTIPPEVVMVMLKDNTDRSQLLMSAKCGAFCYKGTDLASHIPIAYHASMIYVAKGHSFHVPQTWTGCPHAWGSGCPNPTGPVTPIVTVDPAPVSVTEGATAHFSAQVTGSAPLQLQWFRDGQPIPGANGSTYSLTDASAADNGAVFSLEATNAGGSDTSLGAMLTVRPAGGGTSGMASESFNGALGNRWTVTKPAGTTFSVSGGVGLMGVPKGSAHDLWAANRNGLRVTQPAGDTAFEVEAVFPTLPGSRNGYQGIVIESATGQVLRFEVVRTHVLQTSVRASTLAAGSVLHTATLNGSGGVRLRVARAGSTWTFKVARGSGPFTQVAIVSQPMVVSRVGVWAGNNGGNPAFTTKIDSFTVVS